MTLTRAPCELDKMSLFQDLKLKRRKVDSRCSSDGESVADTSTSSPDLVSPSSPKMSEAVVSPPSPDSTPHHPPEPTLDSVSSRLEDSGVFDGGGVIRPLPRSQSPPLPAPAAGPRQPPRPHSSPHSPGMAPPEPRSVIISPLWKQRINGVKPELIGGSPARPPGAAPARQTPTVIMGEAGGVRTMIWSQPETPPHATTSWGSAPEESAAQMLLNLGQDRIRPVARNVPPQAPSTAHFAAAPLNMERLWAGDLRQLPLSQTPLNLSSPPPVYTSGAEKNVGESTSESQEAAEEEEQPMICMICEDKATGLHYGIITCEGCKGFFKRTVQNRRVYTCVADGNCEITKAQRNRCQYCRFKKCIEQGMVLQAVREDRMPGGRNSGAVYNLYKVKYKKHKKPACKQPPKAAEKNILSQQFKMEQPSSIPANLVNGTILKTALTNPSEVVRLRQRLDSAVSSSRDRNFSIEYSLSMIKTLIDCDEFQDIATLQNLDDLLDHNTDLSEKLCHIGDSIVYKLVQWTKRLPFYLELPVEVHTRLLTHKWHELLVLTTSAYQAIHKAGDQLTTIIKTDFNHEVETNLCTLQSCLTSMMGREITIEQLRQDVGLMIEKITHVTLMFRQIKLTMEEYVCLKVITMLNQAKPASSSGNSELESIHERYMTCLRVYTQHMYPQQTTRFQDLLGRLPEIQSAASLLLESKMFYVPFLLNSAIQR
ncbi:hormone receptor 4 isoform X2 [Tribolium castaneum]|uniref:HR4 n=3 Tax=Tribolium castaneum TaxID=7070 RepID=A0A139WN28_TRICA|nr:PREDICTED: hormone receptor 4 isoform X2 [Tribolium castaneum]XP_008201138.1 PREDICTED: hormone receptor 4 isoform X2 [Tribolium castaneum]KYB29221.1 HR4 [Tribolium castaneum]|eukprot:XP_008201137.1 PREDICTED: hormone receptor 4 isoform X2 [Tribolium castaneum]